MQYHHHRASGRSLVRAVGTQPYAMFILAQDFYASIGFVDAEPSYHAKLSSFWTYCIRMPIPDFHRQVYDQEYIINRQYCETLRRHLKTYFRRESLFYILLVGSLMQARTLPAAFHNLWSYSLRNRYQVLFMKILRMDHNGRVIISYRRFRFRMRHVKYCPGDADHDTTSRNLLLHGKKEETKKMSHLIILFLSFIYWTARVFRCNRTT